MKWLHLILLYSWQKISVNRRTENQGDLDLHMIVGTNNAQPLLLEFGLNIIIQPIAGRKTTDKDDMLGSFLGMGRASRLKIETNGYGLMGNPSLIEHRFHDAINRWLKEH